jgi:hypothetical protein
MKKAIFLAIMYTLLISGCERNNYDAPGCIEDKIREFSKSTICDTGASVAVYKFKARNVYVFSDGSCGADMGASVYSQDCNSLGFLGGISGNTLIQGVKFYDEAKFVKRLWQN